MSDDPIDELAMRRRQALLAKGKGYLSCDFPSCARIAILTPMGGGAFDIDPAWSIKSEGGIVVVLCPAHKAEPQGGTQ